MMKEEQKEKNRKQILILFLTFMKIGLFTFGGGYAMIALLEKEFVERKKWIEHEEFMNVIAIAESTPGPIAINCATYIGYKMGKFFGALFATFAVCLPSFIIIFLISLFFNSFLEIELVEYAFKGIQICVVFLILTAGLKMLKKMNKTPQNMILFILTFGVMITFSLLSIQFSSMYYILIGGMVGLILYLIGWWMKRRRQSLEASKEEKQS